MLSKTIIYLSTLYNEEACLSEWVYAKQKHKHVYKPVLFKSTFFWEVTKRRYTKMCENTKALGNGKMQQGNKK